VKEQNLSRDSTQPPRRFERLRRKADFETVYARGRRVPGRFFIGYYLLHEGGPLRLGVVASRRVGSATRRNRAKRRLREVFRKNEPPDPVAADVVLIARNAIVEASFEEIDRAYVRGVGRALEESCQRPQDP
jgi:ribonuclease P protein component